MAKRKGVGDVPVRTVSIPRLEMQEFSLWLIGDRPLLVNNKLNVAQDISDQYNQPGGKTSHVKKPKDSDDVRYVKAFYVMPNSPQEPPHPKGHYGVPSSGIKKCACSAIRTTGITDNTTIGLIGKSFWVMEDAGGLCLLQYKKLERDIRPVNIGTGGKTTPEMRHRPMFHSWKIKLLVRYNAKVLGEEQIVNLFLHAGQYIGLCEMRAEKKQGQCGGFTVKGARSR